MDEKKIEKVELKIEELEERIAPGVTFTISPPNPLLPGGSFDVNVAGDQAVMADGAGGIIEVS